jgi:hypothetical protein
MSQAPASQDLKKRFVIFGYESTPAVPASADGSTPAVPAKYTADVYMSKTPIDESTLHELLGQLKDDKVVLNDAFEFVSSELSGSDFAGLKDKIESNTTNLTQVFGQDISNKQSKDNVIASLIASIDAPMSINPPTKESLAQASLALRNYELWLLQFGYKLDDTQSKAVQSYIERRDKLRDMAENIKPMLGGSQVRTLRKKMSSKQRRGTQRRL